MILNQLGFFGRKPEVERRLPLVRLLRDSIDDKGLAKQNGCDVKTVIGSLEKALACIQPANPVNIVGSSRTDKGVHALCSSVHVDLEHRKEGYEFDPWLITFTANRMLHDSDEGIRVLQTRKVPDDFHCRHKATARTYVYRLQIPKKSYIASFGLPYSTLELDRIFTLNGPVDMDLVNAAVDRLNGDHDFSAFTTIQGLKDKRFPGMIKTMKVSIEPGRLAFQEHMDLYNECYDVWDIKYTAKSYLYHQIRQLTGVIMAVGRGLLKPDIVTDMLENPMKYHQKGGHPVIHPSVYNVPADGLYLARVQYDEKDLQMEDHDREKKTKLFNPIRELKDNQDAYEYVLKHFARIHEHLLDPESDTVESLKKLYKDGKPSGRAKKKRRKAQLKHDTCIDLEPTVS